MYGLGELFFGTLFSEVAFVAGKEALSGCLGFGGDNGHVGVCYWIASSGLLDEFDFAAFFEGDDGAFCVGRFVGDAALLAALANFTLAVVYVDLGHLDFELCLDGLGDLVAGGVGIDFKGVFVELGLEAGAFFRDERFFDNAVCGFHCRRWR